MADRWLATPEQSWALGSLNVTMISIFCKKKVTILGTDFRYFPNEIFLLFFKILPKIFRISQNIMIHI